MLSDCEPQPIATPRPPGSGLWVVLSILVAVPNTYLALANLSFQDTPSAGLPIGSVIGGAIGLPAFAAILVHYTGLRRDSRSKWKAFVLISLLGMYTQINQFIQAEHQERGELLELASSMETFAAASTAEKAHGATDDGSSPIELPRPGDSDLRKFRYVMDTYGYRYNEIQREYDMALEAAGIATLLEPAKLRTKEGRFDSQRQLAMMNDAIDIMESKINELWNEVPPLLQRSGVSENGAQDFMLGIDTSKRSWRAIISANRAYAQTAGELLSMFESLSYTPEIVDQQWMFKSESDIHRYQTLVNSLNEQAQTEVAVRKDADERRKAAIETIRDAAKPGT